MSGGYRVYLAPSKRFPSLLHCAFCYRGTMSVLASEVRLGRGYVGVCPVFKTSRSPKNKLIVVGLILNNYSKISW